MIRRFALASAIFIAASSAAPAMAGTATSNLTVSSNVPHNCTISSTDSIGFGNYDPISANNATGTGTITVICTTGTAATITLGQGSNAHPDSTDAIPMRRLKLGTNHLSYGLYQNNSYNQIWGNTAGTGASHTGTGSESDMTVYGVISGGQNVPVGSYSDTVVAEVSF
ncbi:MAG: spore coat U domain-containing protein [Aphanizomenon gracile PMC644.10]|nr:spore coat U domain-containing protein [Aphanizomenon gracile PMC644.10]